MMQTYEDGFFSAQIINARCIERGVGALVLGLFTESSYR